MALDTRKIWTSPRLPTLSAVGTKVLELSRHPATAPRELATLLNSDPPLAKKLVAAANSPLCTLSSPVLSTEQALSALGTACVTSLTLSLSLVNAFQGEVLQDVRSSTKDEISNLASQPLDDLSQNKFIERFCRQAVVKAIAAETLCHYVRDGLEYEYFLAGLTLDLGRFALLSTVPVEYLSALQRSRESQRPRCEREKSELGLTAAELGGQLLQKWGFPARLIRGVQSQHASLTAFKDLESNAECSLRRALALASAIGDYLCDDQQAISLFRIRELTAHLIPIREPELDLLIQSIVRRFEQIAPIFCGDVPSTEEHQLANSDQLKSLAIEQLTSVGGRSTDMEVRTHRGSLHLQTEIERRGLPKEPQDRPSHSFHDPLTQVYNHEFFESALHKEVQRCCQVASPLGIAIVQVDRFDSVCETFGGRFGDVVLKRIADILNDLLRSSDTIARVDQQFLILASTPTAKGMQRLADRIRARVEAEHIAWEGKSTPITVSVGASLALPGRLDLDIGTQVVATAREATREAAFGEGNNIYFSSLVNELELNRLFMSNQMRFSRWLVSEGVLDIPRVAKALLSFNQRALRLGDLAIRQELLDTRQVQQVLNEQEESHARFGEIAVQRAYLSEDQLTGLLILQQEDPILVASLFLKMSLLEPQHLKALLRDYFALVPWAAPLNPTAGRG
ncbi:MAG: domain-like protein [Planctomycetaceae bacterium]|nr:domain-like protein [Planctomycetaceae bacterium]